MMTKDADIYRLVYVSRNLLQGSTELVDAEIAAILATARRNNGLAGLTGALLFNADCFAQVLEGDAAAVHAVFERIQCDPRHRETVILSAGPALRREFGGWSMAYAGRMNDPSMRFDGLTGEDGVAPRENAVAIINMLRMAAQRPALV